MESDKKKMIVQDFLAWLHEIEVGGFLYVAAITRRASNLIDQLYSQTGKPAILGQVYITENALLIKTEEIAEYYVEHGEFPKIAIFDDILAHGRNLNRLMEAFQRLVFACLKELEVDCERKELKSEFYESITIWVYAINNTPFFLKQEYQWRLCYRHIWSEDKWRELSEFIAYYIWSSGTNTSYVPSAIVSGSEAAAGSHPDWIRDVSTQYRSKDQIFYLLRDTANYEVYPTVRSYVKGNVRYYTPYFFVGSLETHQVVASLQKAFNHMIDQIPASSRKMVHLFNTIGNHSHRLNVYCQLFYYVFGQITLNVFWHDHFPDAPFPATTDCDKLARNFGTCIELKPLLEDLSRTKWEKEEFMSLIREMNLDGSHNPYLLENLDPDPGEAIISSMEASIYTQALEHEQRAYALKSNKSGTSQYDVQVHNTGEKPAEQFIQEIRKEQGASSADISVTVTILSGLTQMMDWGDVALKARVESTPDGLRFYSAIHNTELSLSIMPRRLGKCFPAFFRFAQLYWREDDFPQRVQRYFAETLFLDDDTSAAHRYTADAVTFAQLICSHRDIVGSMLNWMSVYGDEE